MLRLIPEVHSYFEQLKTVISIMRGPIHKQVRKPMALNSGKSFYSKF